MTASAQGVFVFPNVSPPPNPPELRPFLAIHYLPALKEGDVSPLLHSNPVTCRVDNTERYTTRSKVCMHTHAFTRVCICGRVANDV